MSTAPATLGAFALVAVAMLGASACAARPAAEGETETTATTVAEDTDDSTTTAGTESGVPVPETSTTTDTNDSSDEDPTLTGVFYGGADVDIGSVSECDAYVQDCPEGEKCVPYASTGGAWDANKCVPVTGEGAVGESCVYDSYVSATDDCGADSMCWNATEVEGVLVGTCAAFCAGTVDDPICAPDTACLDANDGSLNVCATTCDPLMQDCGEGQVCTWGMSDFYCVAGVGGIAAGDPCGFVNDCAVGLACLDAVALSGCEGSSCCAEYCDLSEPQCSDPGLECQPFFPEGLAPPDYEDRGLCAEPDACMADGCVELVEVQTVAPCCAP